MMLKRLLFTAGGLAALVVMVWVARPLIENRYGVADPPTAARLLAWCRLPVVVSAYLVAITLVGLWRKSRERVLRALVNDPVRSTLVVYAALVGLGLALLHVPGVFRPGATVAFIDIATLAVSAATLTGLATVSLTDTMTRTGQLVIMAIVQLGGIAIMVLGAAFWLHVRRRARDGLSAEAALSLGLIVRVIVVTVGVVEAVGTALLFWRLPQDEFSTYTRIFIAAFHAVSAFCNAGFSVYARGMAPFYADWDIALTVAGLAIIGGLGFFVFLAAAGRFRRDIPGFNRLAALIVVTSLALVAVGMIGILRYAPGPVSGLEALFHSVAARSSGFTMASGQSLGVAGGAIIAVLMLVGGAPGSTAGGIKVTTLVVLGAAVFFRRERRWQPELQAAVGVLATSLFAILLGVVLLWLVEAAPVRALFFEAVSAFGTVGFSQIQTARFSIPGKLIVIAMMMLGRVMPMIVGVMIYRRASRPPDGTLMIG